MNLNPAVIEIVILLFADGVALLSDTVRGSQMELNILNDFYQKSGDWMSMLTKRGLFFLTWMEYIERKDIAL